MSRLLLPRFNPTLVRLARASLQDENRTLLRFNPTLVRLAPDLRGEAVCRAFRFQSHPGSISTKMR